MNETETQSENEQEESTQPNTETAPESGSEGTISFTQDALTKRLERERKKVMQELGIENAEDFRAQLEKWRKRDEELLSQEEKRQKELDEAKQRAAELEQKVTEVSRKTKVSMIGSAIKAEAIAFKAKDPEIVMLLAEKDPEFLTLMGDEDAEPNAEKVKAFLTKMQKAKPAQFGESSPGSPSNSDGKPPKLTDERNKEALEAMERRMRYGR